MKTILKTIAALFLFTSTASAQVLQGPPVECYKRDQVEEISRTEYKEAKTFAAANRAGVLEIYTNPEKRTYTLFFTPLSVYDDNGICALASGIGYEFFEDTGVADGEANAQTD